ncbi:MAG: hypothetical protein JRJ39_00140 [Deltaproteobacteria bacterium]|nr:hypothetical protein [Deltaproteobacteria bacterium]
MSMNVCNICGDIYNTDYEWEEIDGEMVCDMCWEKHCEMDWLSGIIMKHVVVVSKSEVHLKTSPWSLSCAIRDEIEKRLPESRKEQAIIYKKFSMSCSDGQIFVAKGRKEVFYPENKAFNQALKQVKERLI